MDVVTVFGAAVVNLPRKVTCPFCHSNNELEKVIVATCVLENPQLMAAMDNDYRFETIAEVASVAARLVSNNSRKPVLRCEICHKDITVKAKVAQRMYSVPAQVICMCGMVSDLRFARDRDKVKIMVSWPYLPFLYCRSCKRKLVFPVLGWDTWRSWAYNTLRFFKNRKGVTDEYFRSDTSGNNC